MTQKTIVLAGANGNLGHQIAQYLIQKNANLKLLIRKNSDSSKLETLRLKGAEIIKLDYNNKEALSQACEGVHCVISALAGLKDVIIDSQTLLLEAAISAGVKRFIPSDYSLDFTPFSPGTNRNLDMRREFHKVIDNTKIEATSIFNGAFMDMLTNEMPLILFSQKKILSWGDPNHILNFTTINNTAEYTANVAIAESSPRYLRIAGEQINPVKIAEIMSKLQGEKFKIFNPGGQGLLGFIIKMTKFFSPSNTELYPAWQGMQYMHNMIDEKSKIPNLDNDNYGEIQWTKVEDLLKVFLKK